MRRSNQVGLVILLSLLVVLSACSGSSDEELVEPPDDTNVSDSDAPPALTLVPGFSQANDSDFVNLEAQTLGPGEGTLLLNVTMPYGYKFNNLAPFTMGIIAMGSSIEIDDKWAQYQEVEPTMPLEIPMMFNEGEAIVMMELTIYWCEAIQQTLCFVERRQMNIPLNIEADLINEVAFVDLSLTPPG